MTVDRRVKFVVRVHQGGYGYEGLRAIWREADELGYYGASLWDLLNVPSLECWTTLSALAAETRSIRLIPLVLANLYRHPAMLAKMAATLDAISGGRLELGIGAGGNGPDHRASGLPFPSTPERIAMLEEAVQVIKAMWSGSPASFSGRHYSVADAVCDPPPVQRPWPPILIGGHGETHLLRAVAAHADVANVGFDMSLEDHANKRRVLERHCHAVGRDPSAIEISHNANVVIAEREAGVEAALASIAARRGVTLEEHRHSLGNAIVGTPKQCASQIQRYVDAGIAYFFLLFQHPIDLEALRLFAQEVMPRFVSQ